MATLTIIIVNYNTRAVLAECLTAVMKFNDMTETEVIVVDNASTDASIDMVRREFPAVRLITQPVNVGFGIANNTGVKAATTPYIMLLNSDAILLQDTGGGLVRFMKDNPAVICVGPRIVLPNGQRQPRAFGHQPSLWRIATQSLSLGRLFPGVAMLEGTDGVERGGRQRDVGWLTGVCMVMRRADFLAVGGFSPDIFMYCEDMDLCGRLSRRPGRIVRLDSLAVRHYGGASSSPLSARLRNAVWQQRNLLQLVRRNSGNAAGHVARFLLAAGLAFRIAAGLVLVPTRGLRSNLLLRSSWLRMLDLLDARLTLRG